MDMQTLAQQQQQHDMLASFFPTDEGHHGDAYRHQHQPGGSNGSPASSSSSGLHEQGGGSSMMDNRNNSSATHNPHNPPNPMFSPSSPMQPQSPNSQLTMQLLGSLMQMQGLDNNFPMAPANGFGNTPSSTMNYGAGAQYGNAMNMGPSLNARTNVNNQNFGNPPLLEQQIKLQQLQQLQQLQNQIFQQQIALISGQSPGMVPTTPAGDFHQTSQQQNATSPSFSGLPTPGPSSELRPQQPQSQQLDFDHFSQPLPSPMSSHGHQNLPYPHHNDYIHRGTSSAPEHIAFHVRTGPTPSPHFSGGTSSRQDIDLDISPLTSPWLGAYGGNATRNTDGDTLRPPSNKRGPPIEEPPHPSRKKHSSGMPPVAEGIVSAGGMAMSSSTSNRRPYHKGSKSTTSTPLLRGSRSRSKSGAGNAFATSPLTTSNGGNGYGLPDGSNGTASYSTQGSSGQSLPAAPVDTPSPVDLSMPPPPAPATAAPDPSRSSDRDVSSGLSGGEGPAAMASSSQLTPLTPGVVMKLGPFGPSSSPSTAPVQAASAAKATRSRTKSEATGKASKAGAGLKHILPAAPSNAAAGPSSEHNGPPKKVSHKDAEQKRRDSQKTAYDELRRLLPPITFADEDETPVLSKDGSRKKDEVIPVRGPLPPGALPPRGPPKAGGEGPNKGVSKLQLLICGNQYIRTLKGRVDRRDGEIARLRREVGRLRRKTVSSEARMDAMRLDGHGQGHMGAASGMDVDLFLAEEDEEEGDDIDLERDLDEVEGMGVHIGLVGDYDDEGEE